MYGLELLEISEAILPSPGEDDKSPKWRPALFGEEEEEIEGAAVLHPGKGPPLVSLAVFCQ